MKKLNYKLIVIIIFVFFASHIAHASVLQIDPDKNEIKTGELSNVSISLDTKLNSINTIEGDLVYDQNLLKVEKINIGNSFVSFWVEKPSLVNEGRIHFSGIVPGGITIANGDIFSVIFRGSNEGKANITLENINLFLNDGIGTKDKVEASNTSLNVIKNLDNTNEQIIKNDTTSPEKFAIERTRNLYVYDNKWYLVYSTQDKGTGVDYYEVCEFTKRNCIKSESPYLLKHQTPFYRVVVRAIDMDGNIREVSLVSNWLVFAIVIFFGCIVLLLSYLYRRYLHKYRV